MSLSREPRQKWNSRDQLVQKTPKRPARRSGFAQAGAPLKRSDQGGGLESRLPAGGRDT